MKGDRVYRLYLGQQKCGKTYQLREEVAYFKKRGCTVFICDSKREFGDLGTVFRSFDAYDRTVGNGDEGIPRVCVFQFKTPEAYSDVFQEAIAQCEPDSDKTTCVIVDEFWLLAPAGATWRGSDDLREILLAGRHLENAEGELGQVHIVGAMQYPYSSQLLVWQQADHILIGAARGERFYSWLKGNHSSGDELVERAKALQPREWLLIEGEARPGMPVVNT